MLLSEFKEGECFIEPVSTSYYQKKGDKILYHYLDENEQTPKFVELPELYLNHFNTIKTWQKFQPN